MYEIEELYAEDGSNLKEILKSCIYNYYMKNKKNHRIIDTKYEVLSEEGENNVQTVQ